VKLFGPAARRYLERPDPAHAGLLIYGQDAMRVALKRQQAVAAIVGPDAEAEMRLTRLPGADLRRDPAAVQDAMRAQGFFPGPRVVLIEEATDAGAPALTAALADWRPGDAALVVTGGALNARSKLRKLFETDRRAVAVAIYDDPPSRDEIAAELARAGLTQVPSDAMRDLEALARALDPGDFRQTLEKIALYKYGDSAPLSPADIAECAPVTMDAGLDDLIACAADGRLPELCALMRRIEGQGIAPVSIAIAALRHFRALHAAASAPGGPAEGIGRLRPPVMGPRRDRMLRQAEAWGAVRLEAALAVLVEADLSLRSSSRAPAMAAIERALMRLASMGRR